MLVGPGEAPIHNECRKQDGKTRRIIFEILNWKGLKKIASNFYKLFLESSLPALTIYYSNMQTKKKKMNLTDFKSPLEALCFWHPGFQKNK